MPAAPPVSPEVAERLRRRYPPPRLPRTALTVTAGLLAVALLAWALWAANAQARPAVSGQVLTYRVVSDTQVSVTVTVQRPDPSRAAVCDVVAQAADFQVVGALDRLAVGPHPEKVVDVSATVKTFRRAASASVRSCVLA